MEEYLCRPEPVNNTLAYALAWEYETNCENYDRSVCSGEKDGVAIPLNPTEFRQINVHARKMWNVVCFRALALGVPQSAIREMLRQNTDFKTPPTIEACALLASIVLPPELRP